MVWRTLFPFTLKKRSIHSGQWMSFLLQATIFSWSISDFSPFGQTPRDCNSFRLFIYGHTSWPECVKYCPWPWGHYGVGWIWGHFTYVPDWSRAPPATFVGNAWLHFRDGKFTGRDYRHNSYAHRIAAISTTPCCQLCDWFCACTVFYGLCITASDWETTAQYHLRSAIVFNFAFFKTLQQFHYLR